MLIHYHNDDGFSMLIDEDTTDHVSSNDKDRHEDDGLSVRIEEDTTDKNYVSSSEKSEDDDYGFEDTNDKNYVPGSSDDEEDDDDDDCYYSFSMSKNIHKDKTDKSYVPSSNRPVEFFEEDSMQFPVDVLNPKEDFTGLHALKGNKKKGDKVHYCPYCAKAQTKLKRHLTTVHKDEREVIIMMERNGDGFTALKNVGDHKHNIINLKAGHGDLVVKRQVKKAVGKEEFVPCPSCLGFYYKRDLWRHKCKGTGKNKKAKDGKVLLNNTLDDSNDCKELQTLIDELRIDCVSVAAKNDSLIRLFAKRCLKLSAHDKDQRGRIRNKMRELGRLLIALRNLGHPDKQLMDFISPCHYKDIVKAIHVAAGFDSNIGMFNIPTLALKVGYSLSTCATLLKAQAIEEGCPVKRQQYDDFLQMYDSKWNEDITSVALRTLRDAKRNKVKNLPLSNDLAQLSKYIHQQSEDAKTVLRNKQTSSSDRRISYNRLATLTLTNIILFNKRRQGEASKITINDFLKGKEQNHSEDVLKELSSFERGLCQQMTRIEIVGKKERTVPVILTPSTQDAVQCLVDYRDEMGIPKENTFLFARTTGDSLHHIRGSDCLREITSEVPLDKPELIRSTDLRKHIATMTQLHNLQDNELDILAQFMGHDIRIHREHYRLPSATMQVAKVSQYLLALEQGTVEQDTASAETDKVDDEMETIPEVDSTDDESDDIPMIDATGDGIDNTLANDTFGKYCTFYLMILFVTSS